VFTAYNLRNAALLSQVNNLITNSPTNRLEQSSPTRRRSGR
jgi:hypothetical protein